MTYLLDANVLIALVVADHVHHEAAETWLVDTDDAFATCPITEGSLVRLLVREGRPASAANTVVATVHADERHEFWPDNVSFADAPLRGVIGHRQVTDAYLAELARRRNGRLVTFDQGLAKLHPNVVDLLPTGR